MRGRGERDAREGTGQLSVREKSENKDVSKGKSQNDDGGNKK